jgi:hypothetical protein
MAARAGPMEVQARKIAIPARMVATASHLSSGRHRLFARPRASGRSHGSSGQLSLTSRRLSREPCVEGRKPVVREIRRSGLPDDGIDEMATPDVLAAEAEVPQNPRFLTTALFSLPGKRSASGP